MKKLVPFITILGLFLGIYGHILYRQADTEIGGLLFTIGLFLFTVGTYINNGIVWPFQPNLSTITKMIPGKLIAGILSVASFSLLLQLIYKFTL